MTTGAGGGDGGGAAGAGAPGAPGAAAAASASSAQAGQAAQAAAPPAPAPNNAEFDDMLGAEPKKLRSNMRSAGRQFMASVAEGAQRTYNRVANRFGGERRGQTRINTLEREVQSFDVVPGRSDALQKRQVQDNQAGYAERMRNELHAHEPSRKGMAAIQQDREQTAQVAKIIKAQNDLHAGERLSGGGEVQDSLERKSRMERIMGSGMAASHKNTNGMEMS